MLLHIKIRLFCVWDHYKKSVLNTLYNTYVYNIYLLLLQLYISCNSGARIGLAEEIKGLFRVAWHDISDLDKGFKYIYLSPADYDKVRHMNSVRTEMIEDDGERRYSFDLLMMVYNRLQ